MAIVPKGKEGLAYLACRLALEIPDSDKARALMAQATRLKVSVDGDFSVIGIECLTEKLGDALRAASDIIQSPLLSGMRIDHNKRTMALLGRDREDDASDTGHDAALGAFFLGQGCGGAIFGTAESLKRLEKKDVVGYYDRFFTKRGLFLCVCTDLDTATIRMLLEKAFTKFREGRSDETALGAPPVKPDNRRVAVPKDSKQTYVARAFALPPVNASEYARGYLLETVLGNGPGSRLWNLRVKDKLAYNVNARLTWMKAGGILEAYLETEKANAEKAGPALTAVLEELGRSGVTPEELAAAKILAKTRFLRTNEAKDMRTMTMGTFESLGLGAGFISGIFDALDAVTTDDLNAFIKKNIDPGLAVEITVGPATSDKQGRPAAPGFISAQAVRLFPGGLSPR